MGLRKTASGLGTRWIVSVYLSGEISSQAKISLKTQHNNSFFFLARTARKENDHGYDTPSTGTHILQRTAATRMLQVVSLKEIADALRHRSIDTTAFCATVNVSTLAEVALPWLEVQP